MWRSQLRVHMCQTRKSDRQEWQSLVVLNGTKIFLNETNISFLKFICGILNRGVANSFWNHLIQISSGQMYLQDIYSNLWKVKVFIGNMYSLKSNTYFWGTVMFVQDGFLYLIVTKHKLTVCSSRGPAYWSSGAQPTAPPGPNLLLRLEPSLLSCGPAYYSSLPRLSPLLFLVSSYYSFWAHLITHRGAPCCSHSRSAYFSSWTQYIASPKAQPTTPSEPSLY